MSKKELDACLLCCKCYCFMIIDLVFTVVIAIRTQLLKVGRKGKVSNI